MVNPHYPEYYRGKRERATDNENPIPNYFPAVEAGAAFGFAVLLNRTPGSFDGGELLGAARGWAERALTEKGAGAKTAAGYGWFKLGAPKVTTHSEIAYAIASRASSANCVPNQSSPRSE